MVVHHLPKHVQEDQHVRLRDDKVLQVVICRAQSQTERPIISLEWEGGVARNKKKKKKKCEYTWPSGRAREQVWRLFRPPKLA